MAIPQGLLENGDLRVRRCRHGFMLYSLRDIYIGRSFEAYGEYCQQEVALYQQLLHPGDVVVDCGANIGSHTVFFAGTVGPQGLVHAFEPQRVIHQMLCANLALNGLHNARAHHAAVGAAEGMIAVPAVDYAKATNFGGVSLVDGAAEVAAAEEVPVMTVDGLGLERCDLIKIDVQGMEAAVLAGADATIERCRPVLYVENDLKDKSRELIGALFELGYRLYWHLPRLFDPENFFGQSKNIFANTVNVNMLCLPKDDDRRVGLKEITSVDDWWKDPKPAAAKESEET
jgi:FkbM family methyltransferase